MKMPDLTVRHFRPVEMLHLLDSDVDKPPEALAKIEVPALAWRAPRTN